jgi:hypothetical protein
MEWIGDFGLLGFESYSDLGAEGGGKRRKDDQHGLPKLVPVGEWMGPDVCEQLLDYTSYKLHEKAIKEKQKGNAEFASGNLKRALQVKHCCGFFYCLISDSSCILERLN